ncbi:MAG TPA: hypothetical protein V6D15_09510 [Oculatellaceae cyanobacterium]|jgi:hypothetical protein
MIQTTASSVQATEATASSADSDITYVLELEAKLETDFQAREAIFSEIEIDSTSNSFGIVYRVWQNMRILGTFYRSPSDGKWIAEPFCSRDRRRYKTADSAQKAIIKAWKL